MLENRPIGFIGQNAGFLSKKSVLKPMPSAVSEPAEKKALVKTDSAQINSLLLKGNSKAENFSFYGMNIKPSSNQEKVPGIKTELADYKIDDQGDTNSCGTTSLTSVLKYFGANVKDHWEIDKEIRSTRFDMFTAPGHIVSYAESKGFRAGLKNNSSLEDLASFVDKGVPVIILIDPGEKFDFNMHWIVVTGYERNVKGEIENVRIADPSGGWSYTKSASDLKKDWGNIRVGSEDLPLIGGKRSFSSGYNNLMIPIVPKNKTIKTPDGKTISTNSIKIPYQPDSAQGYGARVVAKGAVVIDKTLTATQSILNYASSAATSISNNVSYYAKKLGL